MIDALTSFLPQIEEIIADSSQMMPALLTASGGIPFVFKRIHGLIKMLLLLCGIAGISLFAIPKVIGNGKGTINQDFIKTASQYTSHYNV